MPSSSLQPVRTGAALVRVGVGVALLATLTVGGWWGWREFRFASERREGIALVEERRFDLAEASLRTAYERRPDDVEVLAALSAGYLESRRWDEAGRFLNRWCALRPADPEPLRRRLKLSMKRQEVEPAIADAERLLALTPDDFGTRETLAGLLQLAGRHAEAEREAQRCLQMQPQNQHLWQVLAMVYRAQGRTAEAVGLADRLLKASPRSSAAQRLRAGLHLDAGEPEPAIALLQQAAAQPGVEGAPALYELSLALARAGRDADAKQALAEMQCRQAVALWSEDERRDQNVGLQARVVEAFRAAGKPDAAIRFLTDIVQRQPDAAGAHQLLAECYEQQGRREQAAEHRRRAGGTP